MNPIDRLFALEQMGIRLGLENIRVLLDALGRPQCDWPAVHIGGTNGKGSVSAMVETALRATGHRTGRYTSPHLDRLEERFAIDGAPVEEGTLQSTAARVLDEVGRLQAQGHLASPTFFEVTTAIAFELFRLGQVDVGVIEVGLGGRFDATNVLAPTVTALTSIDFDHEAHLGATLASIAFEKAGIAKAGVPMVVGEVPDEAFAVVSRVCEDVGAPLIDARTDVWMHAQVERGRVRMHARTPVRAYPSLLLSLAGGHQRANAAVALRTLEVCASRGIPAGASEIVTGLSTAIWPARLEWLRMNEGALLIDAAHNPAGARALADYLRQADVAPLPLAMAAMADKRVDEMLHALSPVISTLVATQVPARRAVPAEELAAAARAHFPADRVETCLDPDLAVARALALHRRAVAAGSIFLVGPLRARLLARGARVVDGPG